MKTMEMNRKNRTEILISNRKRGGLSSLQYLEEDFDEDHNSQGGILPAQRNAANARERARMRVLSSAFGRLKTKLPNIPPDTKLSKLDTLRLATIYIKQLKTIVDAHDNLTAHDDLFNQNTNSNDWSNLPNGTINPTWPFGLYHHNNHHSHQHQHQHQHEHHHHEHHDYNALNNSISMDNTLSIDQNSGTAWSIEENVEYNSIKTTDHDYGSDCSMRDLSTPYSTKRFKNLTQSWYTGVRIPEPTSESQTEYVKHHQQQQQQYYQNNETFHSWCQEQPQQQYREHHQQHQNCTQNDTSNVNRSPNCKQYLTATTAIAAASSSSTTTTTTISTVTRLYDLRNSSRKL